MKFYSHAIRPKNNPSPHGIKLGKLGRQFLLLGLIFVPALLLPLKNKLLADEKAQPMRTTKRIRAIVDRYRRDLSIREPVSISIVAKNDKLVSVERNKGRRGGFVLSFDETFLKELDDNELSASIAHELGHVWIFTHHPYLHTELLANQIALRVVSRESLEKIYAKVWRDKGKGDLDGFLGTETAVGLKPDIRVKSLPKTTERLTK
jgi:hypothetical protein